MSDDEPFAKPPFCITDKVGILDPHGLKSNPLTGKPYVNYLQEKLIEGVPKTYANIAKHTWMNLGVYTRHAEVLKMMNENQIVCAKSGTGSGKTVIFPKFALHVGGYRKKVLCAIPKQIITKSSAEWAATTMDVRLGAEVGFFYKNNHNRSNKTMLTFSTTGSVIAVIKKDPTLSEYDYLVIDEAHERSVDMDLLLRFVKEMVMIRRDIKIVIMSATIDPEQYRRYFSGVPNHTFRFGAIDIPAIAPFPRIKNYATQPIPKGTTNPVIEENIVRIISDILDSPPLLHDKALIASIHKEFERSDNRVDIVDGDILAFVTSGGSANKICNKLNELRKTKSWPPFFCTKLEGKSSRELIKDKKHRLVYLPNEDKPATEADFAKDKEAYRIHHPLNDNAHPFTRKIVVSTDVAESSITIDGVTYVIDSGVTLDSAYSPQTTVESLKPKYVARDAIEQRQGRVGRSNPGVCYHLYTETELAAFDDITTPDIRKTDLTSTVLEIMSMDGKDSVANVRQFFNQLIEPPNEEFISTALNTLHSLGAITSTTDTGKRNMFGRAMSYFRSPITPAQAKCLIISKYYNCSHEMAELVALLDACENNLTNMLTPRTGPNGKRLPKQIHPHLVSKYGDHLTLLHCYDRYKKAINKKHFCKKYGLLEVKFASIAEASKKCWVNLDTLFEREDDLTDTDPSLVLDETNIVESRKKEKTRTHLKPQRGGAFTITDDLKLGNVNESGLKDIDILYAMYPDGKRNVNTIAEMIQKQDDPAVSTDDLNAEKVQLLLTSRLQRYNSVAFAPLSIEQKKLVLSAIDKSIRYREMENKRITTAHQDGKATVAELADARGHDAWITQLKILRTHALRHYRQEQGELRNERRKRVEDMLYKHIENKPKDISTWDNWEERLMRVMFEGYCLQSAVRHHEGDKVFHTVFPTVSTRAPFEKDSILAIPALKRSCGDVIIYEKIKGGTMGTAYQCVSTLPSRVRKNDEVCKILSALSQGKNAMRTPYNTADGRQSARRSHLIRSKKPITLGMQMNKNSRKHFGYSNSNNKKTQKKTNNIQSRSKKKKKKKKTRRQ
jgi:pre-mRNA-splicing factor ATP-dependent RNA helicase DHX15/PRP43